MKIVLLSIFSFFATACFAQKKITIEEVKNHIDDSVEVRGKVSGMSYLKTAPDKPTIITVTGNSSRSELTIIIPGEVRKRLGYNPQEKKYLQGMVIASGKLELVKGKATMVIKKPAQLVFLYDEEVPASEIPPIGH
jgi:hypothetical protein